MTRPIVVTGTDTGIGKTVFAAALAGALDGCYWKPVQSGLEEETDSDVVRRLSGLAADRILPEAYRLNMPASPHLAAAIDGVAIDPARLAPPSTARPLVIEGAGGLLVPLTRDVLTIDVFARWRAPLVLCARTTLGTINHSLLSIEAIRARAIPLIGVAFLGDENPRFRTHHRRTGAHAPARPPAAAGAADRRDAERGVRRAFRPRRFPEGPLP